VTYEEFKKAWLGAIHHSGLAVFGSEPIREGLDLVQLDRTGETAVELRHGQMEPIVVTARISWRWAASQSARTATTEEDLLIELVGVKSGPRRTEKPWLRIDATLSAALPYGHPIAFPTPETWAAWARATTKQIVALEPKPARSTTGLPPSLKWQGAPAARVRSGADGVLRVERIELDAWQGIALPRRFSDTRRKPDPHPGTALDQMFHRLEHALKLWQHAVVTLLKPSSSPTNTISPATKASRQSQPSMATPNSSASRRV
jgi:hypothetical protein